MSRMRLPNRKDARRKGALERLEAQLTAISGRLDGTKASPEKIAYVKSQIAILKGKGVS
jgi:hypothetical protein